MRRPPARAVISPGEPDHRPAVDHDDALRELVRLLQVVRGQHDRATEHGERADPLEERAP
jgi:hypothetical protein